MLIIRPNATKQI